MQSLVRSSFPEALMALICESEFVVTEETTTPGTTDLVPGVVAIGSIEEMNPLLCLQSQVLR